MCGVCACIYAHIFAYVNILEPEVDSSQHSPTNSMREGFSIKPRAL